MEITLSFTDITILCLCIFTGCYARIFSVPVYSLIEKEKYRYLGRVFLHRNAAFYTIHLPGWFIDQSVTTRFVVTLPKYLQKKKRFTQLVVLTGSCKKSLFLQKETSFTLSLIPSVDR